MKSNPSKRSGRIKRMQEASVLRHEAVANHHLTPTNGALELAIQIVKRRLDIEQQHGPVRVLVRDGVRVDDSQKSGA